MTETRDTPSDSPLNPALKQETDTTHDTSHTSPSPFDSTSAHEGEGEGWPVIWLVVTVACLLIAVYLIF